MALVTNKSIKRCNIDNFFNLASHYGLGIALLERLITNSSNPRVANKYDCDCGRSPNGKCLGWHKLGEVEYKRRLALYQEKRRSKVLELKSIVCCRSASPVITTKASNHACLVSSPMSGSPFALGSRDTKRKFSRFFCSCSQYFNAAFIRSCISPADISPSI